MTAEPDRPILGLSSDEAARILGIHARSIPRLVQRGVLHRTSKHLRWSLDRTEVEQVALERYRHSSPYWLNSRQAAELLGVTQGRVLQLVDAGKVPAVKHSARWYFRRPQLEVVANARESRRLS